MGFGLLCIAVQLSYIGLEQRLLSSIEPAPTPAREFATQMTVFVVLTLLMAISGRSVWSALHAGAQREQTLAERNQQLRQEIDRRELHSRNWRAMGSI